jgi:signal transduction histidine kinase
VLFRSHPRQAASVRLNLVADMFQPAIQMVESSLRMNSLTGGARVSVGIDTCTPAALSVFAPRDEVINVIINLIFNARDAMTTGGTIHLSGAPCPGGAVVRVADEGTGIAPADLQRIFEPLFSTKGSQGMGMGLATAAALMRRLNGSIRARNRNGGGACIELTFMDPEHVDPDRAQPPPR